MGGIVWVNGPEFRARAKRGMHKIEEAGWAQCQKTAVFIKERAQALAPVANNTDEHLPRDEHVGELRESVELEIETREATISATAPYAAYVEFGTSHSAAQPFMRPAFEEGIAMFSK